MSGFQIFQENYEDIHTLDSCEYIWESGVGYAFSPPHSPQYDYNRVEILKAILTSFSETLYLEQNGRIYLLF